MKTYFEKLPKILLVFLFVSISYVLLYKIYFISKPEIFSYAEDIGEMMYAIFLSYITSFVFYYLSIHYREEKAKDETIWFLYENLHELVRLSKILYLELIPNENDCDYSLLKKLLSKKKSSDVLGKGRISDETSIEPCLRNITYGDIYYDTPKEISKLITIMFIRCPFIEINILNNLLKIENSSYMKLNASLKKLNANREFMDNLSQYYLDYLKLIDHLEEYLKNETNYIEVLNRKDVST